MCDREILFFYSHFHPGSLRAKVILSKAIDQLSRKIRIKYKSIDVLTDQQMCKKFSVSGVPTTLWVKNDKIFARLLGEFSEEEIMIFLTQEINNKN